MTPEITKQHEETTHGNRTPPLGWRWVKLRELITSLETGSRPKGGAVGITSGVPSLSAEHITIFGTFDFSKHRFVSHEFYNQMSKGHIQQGDVLIVKDGATTGKVAFIEDNFPFQEASINEHVFLCRPKAEIIIPKFLFLWLWNYEGQSAIRTNYQGSAIRGINQSFADSVIVPLPPLGEQYRILEIVNQEMAAIERARAAAEAQLETANALIAAYIHVSFNNGPHQKIPLSKCMVEVSKGIGSYWQRYPLFGATRGGIAPAKERVGKNPERYKLVDEGTIFYNPMRILLGSIAMVDEGEEAGITSPDYVVFKTKPGVLHPRWFYYWLRSSEGDKFIKTLARGAVRERMLFRRLSESEVEVPLWNSQVEAAEKMKNVRLLRQLIIQELDMIKKLPNLLLRRAFNGEL